MKYKIIFLLFMFQSMSFGWGNVWFYLDSNRQYLNDEQLPIDTDIFVLWKENGDGTDIGISYTIDYDGDGNIDIKEDYTGGQGYLAGTFVFHTPSIPGDHKVKIVLKTTTGDINIDWSYTVIDTASSIKMKNNASSKLLLYQNIPNPFNPTTTIPFSLSKNTNVKFRVYNCNGEQIFTKEINGKSGINNIVWNGNRFPSGVYFYSIEYGEKKVTKKMILLK